MTNNLRGIRKGLCAFAKKCKGFKYTDSALITFLITGAVSVSSNLFSAEKDGNIENQKQILSTDIKDFNVLIKEARKENNKEIYILGIETSCDETSAAVVKNGRELLSNIINSQIDEHEKYGGVVPEIASRMHVEAISFVVKKALEEAKITIDGISGIAVTEGPGLVGALLVRCIICKRASDMHIIRRLYQ